MFFVFFTLFSNCFTLRAGNREVGGRGGSGGCDIQRPEDRNPSGKTLTITLVSSDGRCACTADLNLASKQISHVERRGGWRHM